MNKQKIPIEKYWKKNFPQIAKDMEKFSEMIKKGTPPCTQCWKPMKKIGEYEWALDCECTKKHPKLADLVLHIG